MTRAALDQSLVTSLYDKKSRWYDLQHGLTTLKSDERGRRMVVEYGVEAGNRVLDAGGGTGSTALRAAARVGPNGHVVVLEPPRALVRKLAGSVESIIWRFPSLSMGCGPVVTLPALERAGAKVLRQKIFGVPLWPFIFYLVEKPA